MAMRMTVLALVIAASLGSVSSSSAQEVTVPHLFESGTPARAAEVNANFATLADGINAAVAAMHDQAQGPAGSVAVVAALGGDYASPLDAVANLTEGDAWCREPESDAAAFPCLIMLAPGVYELDSTLFVPAFVSMVGYGPKSSIVRAMDGVQVAVQLGTVAPGPGADLGISLRDLSVQNMFGDGSRSIALASVGEAHSEVVNVHALAAGSAENVGIKDGEGAMNRYRWIEARAVGGSTSVGLEVTDRGSPRVDDCTIVAQDATIQNIGLAHQREVVAGNGYPRISYCSISASGGQTATAVTSVSHTSYQGSSITISNSTLSVQGAAATNTGFEAGLWFTASELINVEVIASGSAAENIAVALNVSAPSPRNRYAHVFDRVRAFANGGSSNTGFFLVGYHDEAPPVLLRNSELHGSEYGIRISGGRQAGALLIVEASRIGGAAAVYWPPPIDDFTFERIDIRQSGIEGSLELNGHYVICAGVYDHRGFYPDSCPPGGNYTEGPFFEG